MNVPLALKPFSSFSKLDENHPEKFQLANPPVPPKPASAKAARTKETTSS